MSRKAAPAEEAGRSEKKQKIVGEQTDGKKWHGTVQGIWHGIPGFFDAEGAHCGYVQADRTIIYKDNGKPLVQAVNKVYGKGTIANRLEWACHVLETEHVNLSRVYVGPDFYGAGHPNDTCLLGADYCVPWRWDNRVIIHILDDGKTQIYSTMLSQGPVVKTCINGMYKLTEHGWEDQPEVVKEVEEHIETEKRVGVYPFLLPARVGSNGKWTGRFRVFDAHQTEVDQVDVTIHHKPLDHHRAEQRLVIKGNKINRDHSYVRVRNVNEHYFEGPDLFGNGMAFGRACFNIMYVNGEDYRLRSREFLIDDKYKLSVVWEFLNCELLEFVVFGVLEWSPSS